jgi:alpha-beta hydrolase superfamily lysophospholipase
MTGASATLSPLVTADGLALMLHDWPAPACAPRAQVLLVHGLGEHAGRYAELACELRNWGFAVRAYDQRGHGLSGGPRGGLTHDTALLDDLAEVIDATRASQRRLGQQGQPLILLGHSLGGLVASRFVSLQLRPVDALVMSSPALDPGLSTLQKILVATLPAVAPNLRVNNGLDPRYLSHEPAVVAAYRADPLVHPKISARLARFIATAGPATVAAAADWCVPTLLLYAGADHLVNPAGSRAFAAVAGASAQVQPGILSAQAFESHYHEIFNEAPTGAAAVRAALKTWLDARFGAQTRAG